MIVTCEHCTTQFQLDDAKVPATGVRVRCSRCSHTFHVESSERPDAERGADLARDALGGAADDLESDWEFNDEVTTQAAADPVAAAVDDLLGADFAGPAGAADPPPDLEFDPEDLEAGESESDAGERAALDESEDPESLDLADGPNPLGAGPGLAIDDPDESEFEIAGEWDAAAGSGPADAEGPEIAAEAPAAAAPEIPAEAPAGPAVAGTPAAEPPQDPEGPLDPAAGVRDPGVAVEHVAARRRSASAAAAAAAETVAAETASEGAPAAAPVLHPDVSAPPARIGRVASGLGWIAVTALCVHALGVGLFGASLHTAPAPSPDLEGIELTGVRGRWIENAEAGPLFVVTGSVRTSGSGAAAGGRQLRVRLVDAAGRPVVAESASLGPPLPAAALRESRLPDLKAEQEAAAWSSHRVDAGAEQPFVAILGRVPPAAESFEFTLDDRAAIPVAPPEPPIPDPDLAAPEPVRAGSEDGGTGAARG